MLQSRLDVKSWMKQLPTVDAVRPGSCPHCQAASRPLGAQLGIWGHGLRARQLRGPLEPAGQPGTWEVQLRRYLCRSCRAVITVGPRGLLPCRHYWACAVALALVLFGPLGLPGSQVRARVSPWQVVGQATRTRWLTLTRWARAASAGLLFPGLRRPGPQGTTRQVASQLASELAGHTPVELRGASRQEQVFRAAGQLG